MNKTAIGTIEESTTKLAESPAKARTTPREQYLLEIERIKREIGDLEQIRMSLGLSQRRLCQLLLVDPSAWTRWLKTGAPPHVYQALKWLVELKTINPDVVTPTNLASRVDILQVNTQSKIKKLEEEVDSLQRLVSMAATVSASATPASDHLAIEIALKEQERRFEKVIAELQAKLALLTEAANKKPRSLKNKRQKKAKMQTARSKKSAKKSIKRTTPKKTRKKQKSRNTKAGLKRKANAKGRGTERANRKRKK